VKELHKATQGLRAYLDSVGFANIYRYIVSLAGFHLTPLAVSARSRDAVAATSTYLEGDLAGRRLLWTLMTGDRADAASLSAREHEVAAALVEAGLLRADGDGFAGGDWQLIAVGDVVLFIDRAINFPLGRPHQVYIGPDTLLLLHYLDRGRLRQGARALDLCTGSGVLGLCAARAGAAVLSTDIADRPLFIAGVNRLLNGLEAIIDVRREDLHDTLRRAEPWDLITCNPPFVAAPPELKLPIFARGPGRDGLDLMRAVVNALDARLADDGAALLVADLLGDERQPFFVSELEAVARQFAVEVYIDQRLPAEGHAVTMGRILAAHNPGLEPAASEARARQFILGELGARNIYLTVIRVRRAELKGLLVCNRFLTAAKTRPA
jgi:hypothetical protein